MEFEQIVEFYDEIYDGSIERAEQVSTEIRKFAEENLDWSTTMEEVLNYLKAEISPR